MPSFAKTCASVLMATCMLCLLAAFQTAYGDWNVTFPDTRRDFSRGGLVVGSSGAIHLVYGHGSLYHAKWTSGFGWRISTIDGPINGSDFVSCSVAIDTQNQVHVAYRKNHDLYYAFYDGFTWSIEMVYDGSSLYYDTAIVADGNDRPHIAFMNGTGSISYAHYNGTSWDVVLDVCTGKYPDIAVDSSNAPHIVYLGSGDLKHVTGTRDGWSAAQTLDSNGTTGLYASLAIDSADNLHVSYNKVTLNPDLDDLMYYTSGHTPVNLGSALTYTYSSITLDGSDLPHVSSWAKTNFSQGVKYAPRLWSQDSKGNWSSSGVEYFLEEGYGFTAVAELAGTHWVAYMFELDLRLAQRTGSDPWERTTVDTTGAVGEYPSIALDPGGSPHVVYTDELNGTRVRYARFNGNSWDAQTIEEDVLGAQPAIAVDGLGRVHVCYLKVSDHDLRYALYNGSTWAVETVAATGGLHYACSIAVDGNNLPHLAYYENSGSKLKYAHYNGSTWVKETPDPSPSDYNGYYPSIALDSRDRPHISYQDTYNYWLKYAVRSSLGWQTQVVDDSSDELGLYTSIAMDSQDHPHITHYDYYSSEEVKYARWDGSVWHHEVLPNSYEGYAPLVLDRMDRPHIVFGDDSENFLTYAVRQGSSWKDQPAVQRLVYPDCLSGGLALDPKTRTLHLVFFDQLTQDLGYATGPAGAGMGAGPNLLLLLE